MDSSEKVTNKEEELGTKSKCIKGPDIIYVGGWGGKIVGWASSIFFLEKRGGPEENFAMIGGGSLCVL